MSAELLVEARGLSKRYLMGGGWGRPAVVNNAVDGVDLELRKGEILGIVGESGCGKSTLGRLLLGIEERSGGVVRLAGREHASFSRKERARFIQPIFQDPYSSLNPRRRIIDTVIQSLVVQGKVGTAEMQARGMTMLELCGLPRRAAQSFPSELSGGQRQRVAIARALVLRPQVVICDEPTSALDVSVQSQILNLLLDLRAELGLTYLFISHNLAVVEHISDRVAVMYLGRIVEEGPVEAVMQNPRHDYTKTLLAAALLPDLAAPMPPVSASAEA